MFTYLLTSARVVCKGQPWLPQLCYVKLLPPQYLGCWELLVGQWSWAGCWWELASGLGLGAVGNWPMVLGWVLVGTG